MVLIGFCYSCSGVSNYSNSKPKQTTVLEESKSADQNLTQGYFEEFWGNGNISTAGYYQDGIANGDMKWYNEDGILVAKGKMVEGKRNGLWKICDANNPKWCINANFDMEVREGQWEVLHKNGRISRSQKWVKDKMVSEVCYDENGKEINCQ